MACVFKRCRTFLGVIVIIAYIIGLLFPIHFTLKKANTRFVEDHRSRLQVGDFGDIDISKIISTDRKWNDSIANSEILSGPLLQLLKKKPPVFLPDMKNPCWYDDDNNRRKIWMERICSDDKYVDTRRRCKMYSGDRKKNTTLRCLPYFLLIGQPKSGSTSLYSRIMQHPDIISGFLKEPHWWARCRHCRYLQLPYCNSTLLPQSFTEYGDHFSYVAETLHISNKSEKERIVTGEGSQSTLWDHHWWWEYPGNENDKVPRILNAHFIRHILPDVKLLVILRNPVDRLYSDYLFFNKHQQKSVQMFNDKVTHAVHSVNNCLTKNSLRHCAYYKDMSVHVRLQIGLYAVFLKDWMDVFPRKQLLVISLDNFSTNQSVVMSKIFKFLGLRDFGTSETNSEHLNQRSRSNKRIGDMLNETRLMLEKFYKPFNKALSLLMNDTSFLWK